MRRKSMVMLIVIKEREEGFAETAAVPEVLSVNTTSISAEGVSGKSVRD